jgi:hypothetical protein
MGRPTVTAFSSEVRPSRRLTQVTTQISFTNIGLATDNLAVFDLEDRKVTNETFSKQASRRGGRSFFLLLWLYWSDVSRRGIISLLRN